MKKIFIKTGDLVKVLSGDDRGKTGTVLKVYPKTDRAIVRGINIVTKHKKADKEKGEPGKIEKVEAPIKVCKLMYFDTESNQASRIGRKLDNGKRRRYMKKTGMFI